MTQVESFSPRRARRAAGHGSADHGSLGRAATDRAATDRAPGGGGPTNRGRGSGNLPQPLGEGGYRRSAPPFDPDEDLLRRGSHATLQGQGFSWVLLWTILGALVPGVGLIASGWRRVGLGLLFLLGLMAAGLLAFLALGNVQNEGVALALDPQKLMLLAVLSGGAAFVWVLVVLLTNTQLRRYATLTTFQSAFSWIVVLALVVGIGLPAYKISSYAMITRSVITSKSVFQGDGGNGGSSTRPNTKIADPWAGTPQINILLIGSDAGADRTGIRPDTMILASINTKTGNTVMFSLPRSLQHARFVPGSPGAQAWPDGYWCSDQSCLLNAIWTWASTGAGQQYYKKYKNPGLRATEDAVEGVTGLKVDNYVMLNLNGFKDFVDAIGGVTVDVHDRLPIGGNGDPKSSAYHVATGGYIEKGNNQHLDGFHALWFARSRWAFDDYNRMQRQRCVIGDVVDQSNPAKLALNFPAIARALKKNLSTGISTSDLSAWVDLAQRVKKASVKSLVFDRTVIDTVNPDFDKVHTLVAKAVKATTIPKKAKAAAGASAGATTGTSPGATTSTSTSTKKPKATKDSSKAQSLKAVC